MKKILLSVILSFWFFPTFAIDCGGRDEKLVKVDAAKLATNMYDKVISADKIEKYNYKTADGVYTSGRWKVQNEKDKNLNVIGVSICIDNDENLNFKNIKMGNYCWCNVESIDNYRISSQWHKRKEYKYHKFDETKYDGKKESVKEAAKQREKEAKEKSIQDCFNDCASACQENRDSLIHKINGFYVCDDALYKLQNARCTIDNKFINAASILVFNDMAEIQILGGGSIIFTPENNFDYVGEYENEPIYLRVKNKEIYVGRTKLSMKECL